MAWRAIETQVPEIGEAAPEVLGEASGRRGWYALEERHALLLRGRVVALVAIAAAAAVLPRDMASRDRLLAAAVCAAALVAHAALVLFSARRPRGLLAAVNAALVVDAALVFALAWLTGGVDGLGMWLVPPLALAATLGYSESSGIKALILGGIVLAGLYALEDPGAPGLEETVGPVVLAAVLVLIAAGSAAADRREMLRRESLANRLHEASSTLLDVTDPEEVVETARDAVAGLLPGWEVTAGATEVPVVARTWRADGRVLMEIPIAAEGDAGGDAGAADGPTFGRITASRRVPRVGTPSVRTRQMRAALDIGQAAGSALRRVGEMRRLEHLSRADGLTGLGNRRAFDEALEEELARAARSGAPVGLVMLDVDHFKGFNDRHGHQAGDEALIAVAGVMTRVARTEDRTCRIGGEEFALLLPGADAAAAAGVAERVRQGVEDAPSPVAPVTVSLGVASARGGATPAELVAAADAQLYAAKASGRNRVVAAGAA